MAIRWGFMGTGLIAQGFAKALGETSGGTKYAVGSRSQEKAESFATAHAFQKAYGSYAALLADPAVDAVYVATPHTGHMECVLAAAAAGKHILCEKPLGVTEEECRRMIEAAARRQVVLLEAFMYRVHPQTLRIQNLVANGAVGTVRTVQSAFHFGLGDAYNVRLDKTLRGGGLYDVGCYCVNFSRMVAQGEPDAVQAVWTDGPRTGVDESLVGALRFPGGVLASFSVGIRSANVADARIIGTEGTLSIGRPWNPPGGKSTMQLVRKGKAPEEIVVESPAGAFVLEAEHAAAVFEGQAKPLIPAGNAVGNAAVLDAIWRMIHA